jgi:hypothetical protein
MFLIELERQIADTNEGVLMRVNGNWKIHPETKTNCRKWE